MMNLWDVPDIHVGDMLRIILYLYYYGQHIHRA
jgi:hypothetical protein